MPEEDLRAWRRALRRDLVARRMAVPRPERRSAAQQVAGLLPECLPRLRGAKIGFYWPFRGEIDLRGAVGALIASGVQAALPVIAARDAPLVFWAWEPGTRMRSGLWNIPVPAQERPVRPDTLLVPLVGFDAAGFRLGNGGGYYDRTLAAWSPRPFTIGIGYSWSRLETIRPQAHDIPMDVIVTEDGLGYSGADRPTAPGGEPPAGPPD